MSEDEWPQNELAPIQKMIEKAIRGSREFKASHNPEGLLPASEWYAEFFSLSDQGCVLRPIMYRLVSEIARNELFYPLPCVLGQFSYALAEIAINKADDPRLALEALKKAMDKALDLAEWSAEHESRDAGELH